jgi:hypothetical protein
MEGAGFWVVQVAGKEHTLTGLWPSKNADHADKRSHPVASAGGAGWPRRIPVLPRVFKCATYFHRKRGSVPKRRRAAISFNGRLVDRR